MAKKNRLKKPVANQGVRVTAPTDTGGSTQAEHVRFSFRHLNPACVDNLERDDLRGFTKHLHTLSTMTWQQVTQSGREQLGHERIPMTQIKVALTVTADVTEVLSFRYTKAERIIGRRERDLLHVLWVTHGHDAYNG